MFKCKHSKCKKKSMIEYKCRCGFVFCVKHKNPEDHKCTFDFREEGKKMLEQKNKKIVKDKVIKI